MMGAKLSKKVLLILLPSILLGGCSVVDERRDAYKKAELLQPLEVPPDLLSITTEDELSVVSPPEGTSVTLSEFKKTEEGGAVHKTAPVIPASPRMHMNVGLDLNPDEVRIMREGNHYWLVLPGQPEQWWQRVKRFWQSRDIGIEMELPALGLLQTKWIEDKSKLPETSFFEKAFSKLRSTNLRDQYVVRLESTPAGDATEVHIVHRGMTHEVYGDNLRWLPRPRDIELEIEAIKRLALYLGVGEEKAERLLEASKKTTNVAAVETADKGGYRLRLDMSFAQAWREVGDQLIALGMDVEDFDRSEGIYYAKGNLLSKHHSKADVFSRFTDKPRGEVKAFSLTVREQADVVYVAVQGREGAELSQEEVEYFLNLIKEALDS